MAWRCTGTSNVSLIQNMFRSGIIKNEAVRDAMLATDRALYVPEFARSQALSFPNWFSDFFRRLFLKKVFSDILKVNVEKSLRKPTKIAPYQ